MSPSCPVVPEVLQLRDCEPIASGALRYVFQHPKAPDLLVKVVKPRAIERWWRNTTWWKRPFRRYRHLSHILREVQEHLVSRLGDQSSEFVQNFIGFVDTDYGLGTIVAAEQTRDGELAPTLKKLVATGRYDDQARRAFEIFAESLLASDIIAMDLNPENLVYAYHKSRGDRFVIIDGLGEKTLVKIHSMSPYFNRRCKIRRINRLRDFVASAPAPQVSQSRRAA